MSKYRYAHNNDIEIRVNFQQSAKQVDFRFTGEDWQASPFQTADVNDLDEHMVLAKVDEWLEGQY